MLFKFNMVDPTNMCSGPSGISEANTSIKILVPPYYFNVSDDLCAFINSGKSK